MYNRKPRTLAIVLAIILGVTLSGCAYQQDVEALDQYRRQMETFSSTFSSLGARLAEIDPSSEASQADFEALLDDMTECVSKMAAARAPESCYETSALCGQAADAMSAAADAWKQALQSPEADENVFASAQSSYQQACTLISQMTTALP